MLRPVWTEDANCFSFLGGADAIQHEVTLSDYAISKYETTWKEFDAFRLSEGKEIALKDRRERHHTKTYYQSNSPAWSKGWQEVKNHCLWLGELTGLGFDLPTEAQWEYAARSRGQKRYYATDDGLINSGVNYAGNSKIHAVGLYPPNPLGLYDMTGNTNEWVNDWFDKVYYSVSPTLNPQGPQSGDKKVMRGGSARSGLSIPNFMTTTRIGVELQLSGYSSQTGFRCASH
ncbi:formylglycine-generating enzyme family protein [Aliivibrio sp.]|uniref:formylglycine-generating enzyme family protein n=1 Tax=Aliivibrio sp. TaxID=1872443 RepID=UPI003D2EAFB0